MEKITLGQDCTAWIRKSWFVEKVIVNNPKRGDYNFTVNKWFDLKKEDGKVEREIMVDGAVGLSSGAGFKNKVLENFLSSHIFFSLETNYSVTIKTGDVRGGGTKASISITLLYRLHIFLFLMVLTHYFFF